MARGRKATDGQKYHKTAGSLCLCGAALLGSGLCSEGGGYPAWLTVCPIACPICRKALTWAGACNSCYGSTTGLREEWTFPGDRYELAGGHWCVVARGPRPVCTVDENRAGLRRVAAIFSEKLHVVAVDDWPDLDWEPGASG